MIRTYNAITEGAKMIDPINKHGYESSIISYYADDNSILKTLDSKETDKEALRQISKDISHWQTILQLTGGDLSIIKCTVNIMRWKWTELGEPVMKKIDEVPGEVTVESTITNKREKLQRMECNQADRQLGIRMAMDRNFENEFEHRVAQSKKMGNKLYGSPLNSIEAYLVY